MPIDVVFGPNKEMFVADFGIVSEEEGQEKGQEEAYIPNTGVIWKITKL
jgi:hypothetical protein